MMLGGQFDYEEDNQVSTSIIFNQTFQKARPFLYMGNGLAFLVEFPSKMVNDIGYRELYPSMSE